MKLSVLNKHKGKSILIHREVIKTMQCTHLLQQNAGYGWTVTKLTYC